jgi:DNA-directed RNA polymerase specialized sigma24 family protein
MRVPDGLTEAEIIAAIDRAVRLLAPSFAFGYYDIEDMMQEGYIHALQVLEKDVYDTSRPLDNFIYTHIRNRFINMHRDKLRRTDAPCATCHGGEPCTSGSYCQRYSAWLKRNRAKASLMKPGALVEDGKLSLHEIESDNADLFNLIDEKLDVSLRATYLQMRCGVSVTKAQREAVLNAIKEILNCGDEEG